MFTQPYGKYVGSFSSSKPTVLLKTNKYYISSVKNVEIRDFTDNFELKFAIAPIALL